MSASKPLSRVNTTMWLHADPVSPRVTITHTALVSFSLLFELTELQNMSSFKEFTLVAHIHFQAAIKKS